MSESDTPKTDAIELQWQSGRMCYWDLRDALRKSELELAAMTTQRDELAIALDAEKKAHEVTMNLGMRVACEWDNFRTATQREERRQHEKPCR